ncbi:hypothetical protein B0G57_109225 [Trinickia symbiotica]|uniref:PhaM family polyhydroxyalkanoate granule multifunctional regulatory protein n=1 Tax=Trinickia symbiotica TaxID=863227 RepID=UPI0003813E53|nr:PhaM family polyhydroxyalkanoate granule multifunctional regulatory protein [Trinickia symbiotica]PPK44389.1 hypothetical protein B0G57_109225 [Trinickia symbiotica]
MTDTTGDNKPFPGFPGFPPAEMLDKMWDMMRLTPFGAAFPGMQPGTAQGLGSPLAAMSDMMAPLMSVEELDKRITDMRAVEQWLKLNLSMLQSATQALEVQRATLSTLRAFGAFAQASMTEPAQGAARSQDATAASAWGAKPRESAAREEAESGESTGENASGPQGDAPAAAAFDPAAWWNLLQSQFNQLASFAVAQSGAAASPGAGNATNDPPAKKGGNPAKGGSTGKRAADPDPAGTDKPAAKRSAARKPGDKPAGSSPASSTEK